MTMLGIWTAYFFSGTSSFPSLPFPPTHLPTHPPTHPLGHYPTLLSPIDPVLAVGFLAIIIHGIINSEVALARELEEKAPSMTPEGVWITPTGEEKETRMEIVLNHRVASYPNLLHVPVLYNIIVGGQPWMYKVMEKFPLEPTLLFHASFGTSSFSSPFLSLFICMHAYVCAFPSDPLYLLVSISTHPPTHPPHSRHRRGQLHRLLGGDPQGQKTHDPASMALAPGNPPTHLFPSTHPPLLSPPSHPPFYLSINPPSHPPTYPPTESSTHPPTYPIQRWWS